MEKDGRTDVACKEGVIVGFIKITEITVSDAVTLHRVK
jgi:hypothetical protein